MPTPRRFTGWFTLRWKILERDGFTCRYCGRSAPSVPLEVDHIIPLEDGGTDDETNLATACWPCNHGKAGLKMVTRRLIRTSQPRTIYPHGSDALSISRQLLEIIQASPGKTTLELAYSLGAKPATLRSLAKRWRDRGVIEKRDGEWWPIMQRSPTIHQPP